MMARTARACGLWTAFVAGLVAATPSELGYLGPPGTFSEQAAEIYRQATPALTTTVPFDTMTAIAEALHERRIARGIIPVASTAGFPAESSRLLLSDADPGFRIVGEIVVPVELHLLVRPGTSSRQIRRIVSHPSALAEADAFLQTHYPSITREEAASTAAAAEFTAKGDGTTAAVASAAAARLYGLEILDRAVQENRQNATSFWVLARSEDTPVPPAADRLVMVIEAPPRSAALSLISAGLHATGFDIVFVNSRPLPGELYGFRYLVSLAANTTVSSARIESAITANTPKGARALRLGLFGARR